MSSGDAPRLDLDDSLKIKIKSHPFEFSQSSNASLNDQIIHTINLMGKVGLDAEAEYQEALEKLIKNSNEVVSIVSAEYNKLPRNQYLDRWSLIQLLVDLKSSSSLTFLNEVISSPIPAEESKDPHSFSTVGEEIMIRTTAIEGVTRMAYNGNNEAIAILQRHIQHENFSVKRASIQGYLSAGGDDARNRLSRMLPKSDHYILDIRRIDVDKVPQPHGGRYLKSRDERREFDVPPPELFDKVSKNDGWGIE